MEDDDLPDPLHAVMVSSMAAWRKRLFRWLWLSQPPATEMLNLPAQRTFELKGRTPLDDERDRFKLPR